MFHEVKPKEKEIAKLGICRQTELRLGSLVISQKRKVDFQELFTYELASVPMALTNSDGSLSKSNKAQVMHVLEEYGSPSKNPELLAQA